MQVDYILLIRAAPTLEPNPEEVSEVRYVTQAELAQMMDPASGLRWSPWFRIIAKTFLDTWWRDLDNALSTDKHADYGRVHSILEAT
jgi:isopentenyl-diphosphate delta-isomerase